MENMLTRQLSETNHITTPYCPELTLVNTTAVLSILTRRTHWCLHLPSLATQLPSLPYLPTRILSSCEEARPGRMDLIWRAVRPAHTHLWRFQPPYGQKTHGGTSSPRTEDGTAARSAASYGSHWEPSYQYICKCSHHRACVASASRDQSLGANNIYLKLCEEASLG